jgi:hypothetical protein
VRSIRALLSAVVPILVLGGCTSEKAKLTPPATAPVEAKTPSFIPPTAEEAYRLQDDCSRRGEAILREKANVGIALTHEQLSHYNPATNRCYVRVEVHAKFLDELGKYDYSTYLYDGQTQEMLASCTKKPKAERISCTCFGYTWDTEACEEEISNCMNSRKCRLENQ